MSDVFFLPVGVMAPLGDPDHLIMLGFNETTPNISRFHEKYFNKHIPRPLCVSTGPKTRQGSHAWIVMCFLDRAPTPDSMSLLTEISTWHVRLPGDICANCGISGTANYGHRCDNHGANNRFVQQNERRSASTINHEQNRFGNRITRLSTRQDTIIRHNNGNDTSRFANLNNEQVYSEPAYIETHARRSDGNITETQSLVAKTILAKTSTVARSTTMLSILICKKS
jgi:hypothetical protein